MSALDQYNLLKRITECLERAKTAASQLPGNAPLMSKLQDAWTTADAWLCDQAAELPEDQ